MKKYHKEQIKRFSNRIRKALKRINNPIKVYRFENNRKGKLTNEEFQQDILEGKRIYKDNNKRFFKVKDFLLSQSDGRLAFIMRDMFIRPGELAPYNRIFGNSFSEKELFEGYYKKFKK